MDLSLIFGGDITLYDLNELCKAMDASVIVEDGQITEIIF